MSGSNTSYPPLIAYLAVSNATEAIDFYQQAFNAKERFRLTEPGSGRIGHAELDLNGSVIMLADESLGRSRSPKSLGGTAVKFCLMVDDVDAAMARASEAGATVMMPVTDQFYGYRCGVIQDPFGHEWLIQKEIEKVSPEEMQRRWNAMMVKA